MKTFLIASLAALTVLAVNVVNAGPVNTATFSSLALDGYDPVAYFTEGKPVEGSKSFTAEHDGATYRFSSAEHRDTFVADPDRYLPAYGGYCAWAMADGKKAEINPNNWKIVEGRLYLNYNDDIQKKWEADIAGFIQKADAAYAGL